MVNNTEKILDSLIDNISTIEEVQSIGISGGKHPIPKAGEGDFDVFIFCDTIPRLDKRKSILSQFGDSLQDVKVNVFEGGHWGIGDFVVINGVETWLMYFTVNETSKDIEAILNGEYPDKLNNYYYPVGRCAMFTKISVEFDRKGFLPSIKEMLSEYPDKLAETISQYHLDKLENTEDLDRAVIRKDVWFYHFAMDLALDRFLQALFALNRTYFPSRKRNINFINNFEIKPEKCEERLLEVVKLGSYPEGIPQSYQLWSNLVDELKDICNG